jgi:hypothetical protein
MSAADVGWTLVTRYDPEMKSQLNDVTAPDAASLLCLHPGGYGRGTGEFFR